MQTAVFASSSAPRGAPASGVLGSAARPWLVLAATGVGVAALTWRVPDAGLGWVVADAWLLAVLVVGFARGRPGAAAWLLSSASLWLAGVTALRASDWALATAWPGSILALVGASLAASRRTHARQVACIVSTSIDALRSVPSGLLDAARLPGHLVGRGARREASSVVRGALVGAPVACSFALLLSADPRFRASLARAVDASGDGAAFALFGVAVTAGLLVACATLGRVRALGEASATQAPLGPGGPYRVEGDAAPPAVATGPSSEPKGRVTPLTWGIVLGQVLVVFGLYVVATGRALFADHGYLRAAGTETYAAYVHAGFLQVSVATLLAAACVVGGHAAMRPRGGPGSRASRRVPGGPALVAVELVLLALVGLTLASCAHRLALYEEAYGYTYLRLVVRLFQVAVGGALALTAGRCVARGASGWPSALVWSATLFVVASSSFDADGWIARRNVERARVGAPLDAVYLAGLSEDAAGALPEVAAIDRDAASCLDESYARQRAAHTGRGWRARRGPLWLP